MLTASLVSGTVWTLGSSAALLTLWSRWLAWKASQQLPEQKLRRREWHNAKWYQLSNSRWLKLPETVAGWLVHAADLLLKVNIKYWVVAVTFPASPVLVIIVLWIHANTSQVIEPRFRVAMAISGLVVYCISLILAGDPRDRTYVIPMSSLGACAVCLCAYWRLDRGHLNAVVLSAACACAMIELYHISIDERYKSEKDYPLPVQALMLFLIVFLASMLLYSAIVWIEILTTASVGRAVAYAVLFLPFFASSIAFIPAMVVGGRLLHKKREELVITRTILLIGCSAAFSFTTSLLAMFVGHELDPRAMIPQTQRMLWSNAFFDGATVAASLYVFERTIAPRKLFSIPTAVVVDFILGILFACGSLWLGVKSLTLIQVMRVLVGHSVDGMHWEFGAYFWVMHTTFLPLLFYLSVILLCWSAKVFAHYRGRFHQRAKEVDGLSMTASFLGLISAFLAVAAVLAKLLI